MVDWRYHLGVFLSLSALSFFQPVGFETFLCSSLGFPLEHKCTESTFYRRQASKQLWSNNCWHAGEGTVCVCACPFLLSYHVHICIHMGDCVLCMFASESLPAGICACVCMCVYPLRQLVMYACHVGICMHGSDCVQACVVYVCVLTLHWHVWCEKSQHHL